MDADRFVAWRRELADAHDRLRAALRVARKEAEREPVGHDLRLYCLGFCAALDGHHRGEDGRLFPELAAQRPELLPAVDKLRQDHELIARLLDELDRVGESASADEIVSRLDGLEAIMESHFRYEERVLSGALDTVQLRVSVADALGPL